MRDIVPMVLAIAVLAIVGGTVWLMSIPPIPPRVIKTEAERAFMENCLVHQDRHTCWTNWNTLNAP